MQYDIAEHLFATLKKMGYQEEQRDFDSHSTIEISLKELPNLFFSVIDERIWLWSRLSWMDENTLSAWGGELWLELQCVLPWVVTGQPVLGHGSEGYELKALVDEACFRSESGMEELLERFFELCSSLQSRFGRLG